MMRTSDLELLMRVDAMRRLLDAVAAGEWMADADVLDGLQGLLDAAQLHRLAAEVQDVNRWAA